MIEELRNNENMYYYFVILVCSLIPSYVYNNYYIFSFLLAVFILINIILFKKANKIKREQEIKDNINKSINQTSDYRRRIQKIYEDNFDGTEFQNIFDKKIFTIIDMLSDLNKNNLQGLAQSRVQTIINNSLKIYLINIESSGKMIKAHNSIDIDFKSDIEVLLNQNNLIMDKLKEFVTKLIMLNISTKEFEDLIASFEDNLKTLNIIKKTREEL